MKRMKLFKLFCFIPVLLCFISCGNKEKKDETDEKANRTNIVETGELAAVNSKAFVLPRFGRYWYEMRVIGILDHGEIVQEGDSIIQLDPADIKKFIINSESELETQMGTFQKMKVNQDNKVNDLQSQIKNEIANFNLRKIELEASRFDSERQRKIKNLEFEQAKITFEKEQKKLKLNEIIERNDLKIQEIRVKQMQSEIDAAYKILPLLTLRTPISGVFQIAHNRRTGSMVKVGDVLYTGNNMASVPELKWMKVNTFINENDFLKIREGQKVAVRLDAMPKVVFDGEIIYIGKLCHVKENNNNNNNNNNNKSRQKVFDVEVKILKPDERLKPGMTVSCEFLDK